MSIDWQTLDDELRHWRAAGLALPIWWRDDDAVAVTPALDRLTRLAQEMEIPCHLAVIPKHATEDLAAQCGETPFLVPMVHGYAHENHAPFGEKKAEFGHIRPGLATDAAMGLQQISDLFGPTYLRCFVPPWNRITPELVGQLAGLGYDCLSTFTPRATRLAAQGLVQINTHIDPIDWRGSGGMMDGTRLLQRLVELLQDRRSMRADRAEPLGILTHHLVQDEATWRFVQRCLNALLDGGAVPVNLLDLKDNLP